MDQSWFEMQEFRKRSLDQAAWIPLYAVEKIQSAGEFAFWGYKEESFSCGSVAVTVAQRELVEKLSWDDVGVSNTHRSRVEDGRYSPADEFRSYRDDGLHGIHLVVIQEGGGELEGDWLLAPDLLVALGLYREGDVWVCPNEGYVEAARIKRAPDGSKSRIEIKAEFLKDYLCAREMGLWVSSYRDRDEVLEEVAHIGWPQLNALVSDAHSSWEGRVMEIHEGNGNPYGTRTAVMQVFRTNVDLEIDVPRITFPQSEEDVQSSMTEHTFEGRKLYRIMGELWRDEWISPGASSPRVRKDQVASNLTFIVDAAGNREDLPTLRAGGKWLWFKPEVIQALLARRGVSLSWYTRDTGSLASLGASAVHFGVNELGLVNVYAKDLSFTAQWEQQIWAGFNVGPDGGVSTELQKSQAVGRPANTIAPEAYLARAFSRLNETVERLFGVPLFRSHPDTQKILAKCHRFRATSFDGFLSLAKDLARLSGDDIDKAGLLKFLKLAKDEKLGSLKVLERLVAAQSGEEGAREVMGPLFGVMDLRHADAHLASSELAGPLALVGADKSAAGVPQGQAMLYQFVSALVEIEKIFRRAITEE